MTASEDAVRAREQEWVIKDICKELNSSVRDGIQECLGRLCQKHSGFKLVVSSSKSEAVKGIITSAGAGLEDIDLVAKLHSTNNGKPFNIKLRADTEFPLTQVVDAANFLSESLQIVTAYYDDHSASSILNGQMVRHHVSEVLAFIRSSIKILKSPHASSIYPLHVTAKDKFVDLPSNLVFDIYIVESSLVTDMRSLEYLGPNNRHSSEGSFAFLPFNKKHSNTHAVEYSGHNVVEHERIRVESQDPNLISVSAKLTALEIHLETIRRKLDVCLE